MKYILTPILKDKYLTIVTITAQGEDKHIEQKSSQKNEETDWFILHAIMLMCEIHLKSISNTSFCHGVHLQAADPQSNSELLLSFLIYNLLAAFKESLNLS